MKSKISILLILVLITLYLAPAAAASNSQTPKKDNKTEASKTTVGKVKGFVGIKKGKVTEKAIIANINALATAVHKDAVYTDVVKEKMQTVSRLSFNPKEKPECYSDGYMTVYSSSVTDFEVEINAIVWPVPEFKDKPHVAAVGKFAKEIFKQYFPTKYEQVYKIMDNSYTEGKYMNKILKYDNRELCVRTTGMYISHIGGKLDM